MQPAFVTDPDPDHDPDHDPDPVVQKQDNNDDLAEIAEIAEIKKQVLNAAKSAKVDVVGGLLGYKARTALSREAIYIARFIDFLRKTENVPHDKLLGFSGLNITHEEAVDGARRLPGRLDAYMSTCIIDKGYKGYKGPKSKKEGMYSAQTVKQIKDKILSFSRKLSLCESRIKKWTDPLAGVEMSTPTMDTALRLYKNRVALKRRDDYNVDAAVDHNEHFSHDTVERVVLLGVKKFGISAIDAIFPFIWLYSTSCRGDEWETARLCDLRLDHAGLNDDLVYSKMLSTSKGKGGETIFRVF